MISVIFLYVTVGVDPTKRYLYLQTLGGKAFLEHLQDPEPMPGKVTSTFTLYVHFKGQRFKSRSVPCACEPDINEGKSIFFNIIVGCQVGARKATGLSLPIFVCFVLEIGEGRFELF